jgi:BirA family biotin operon repressor/biotin-[acetyl-CoA-carboxylase] ligase
VRVVAETGSTNADLLAAARSGAAEGLVLVAEAQTAGRGRQGRTWLAAPGTALTFSALLRPRGVPASQLGWLPLLAGVAVVAALRESAGVQAELKWPNDVLAGGAKLAGILAESWGDAVVVGIGINVWQRQDELPVPAATSVRLAGEAGGRPAAGGPDIRERLLIAVLAELGRWYRAWLDQDQPGDADGCGLRAAYLRCCATVGRQVTVTLPGDRSLAGTATGVGPSGLLELTTAAGPVRVSAGDVVHLR